MKPNETTSQAMRDLDSSTNIDSFDIQSVLLGEEKKPILFAPFLEGELARSD